MEIVVREGNPPAGLLAEGCEFEFFEPKRIVISPLEMCLLSDRDDLFDDLD